MVVPHLIAVLIAVETDNKLKTLKKEILKHCPEVTILATANSIEQGRKMIDIHQPNMVFMEINQSFCCKYKKLEELEPFSYDLYYINSCPDCTFHLVPHVPGVHLQYLTTPAELKGAVLRTSNNLMLQQSENGKNPVISEPVQKKVVEPLLRVTVKDGHEMIKKSDIMYLVAAGNYSHIIMQDKRKIMECKILKLMEIILSADDFYRVDRHFIANLHYIQEFSDDVNSFITLKDGTILPVSTRNKDGFIEIYNRFKIIDNG